MRALRILIADGYVDFLDMMEHVLRSRGHEPLTAPTENGALDACKLCTPDVLLFDPLLVTDVTKFVRLARERMPSTGRIVALVRDGEVSGEAIDATLRKPFRIGELLALFEQWFA